MLSSRYKSYPQNETPRTLEPCRKEEFQVYCLRMYINGKLNKRKRLRKHGFRARMRDAINVIKARRSKGRKRLTVSDTAHKY